MEIVYQKRWNECAVACISMLFKELKINLTYDEIKQCLKGKSLFDIKRILDENNLESYAFYHEFRILKSIDYSYTILNLNFLIDKHFAILKKEGSTYYLYDPIFGRKLIKKPFKKYKKWTGYAIGIL